MTKELGSFNLPELAAWSHLRLGVVSEQNPIKEAVVPQLPFEIISTDSQPLSATVAKGRVKFFFKSTHTILAADIQRPAVLAELHASFCYLLLTIGSTGRAALLHDEWFNLPEKIKNYKNFLQGNFAGQEAITLVAGLRGYEDENAAQLEYINEVLTGTSHVYRLLMEDDQQLKLYRVNEANGKGLGPSGLIYIPAELSLTHQPLVLAAAPNLAGSNEAEQQLFSPWVWR